VQVNRGGVCCRLTSHPSRPLRCSGGLIPALEPMKNILAVLLLSADWGQVGAAALCSPDGKSFELVSTLVTSGWGDVPAPLKAHNFPAGQTKYQCKVDGHRVLLVITVESPGQGMGEGGGVIFVDKLVVNKTTLLTNAYFNWSVSSEPELRRVLINPNQRGLVEQLCYATDSADPHSPLHCESKQIDGSNSSSKRTREKPRAT
jgi:hypothetical protein